MKFLASFFKAITQLVAITIGLYWLLFGFLVIAGPIPYSQLDFNHDGNVSLSEASDAAEAIANTVVVSNKTCTEYIALKDGRTLAIVCP